MIIGLKGLVAAVDPLEHTLTLTHTKGMGESNENGAHHFSR